MSIVGRTYLEKGEPVVVVAQWRGRMDGDEQYIGRVDAGGVTLDAERIADDGLPVIRFHGRLSRIGPRNVMIRRSDGTLVVRPFRGLRKAGR